MLDLLIFRKHFIVRDKKYVQWREGLIAEKFELFFHSDVPAHAQITSNLLCVLPWGSLSGEGFFFTGISVQTVNTTSGFCLMLLCGTMTWSREYVFSSDDY